MRGSAIAVFGANAKVNGKSENLHPSRSETPLPIWMPFETYHTRPARDSMSKVLFE